MYDKIITPTFEQNGKRKHLIGYTGELYDGNILLHSQSYDTNSQAEQALDRIVYDLLTDLHAHGLVDDVPAALEAEGVTSTHLPSWAHTDPPIDLPPTDGPGDPIPGDPGYEYPHCHNCAKSHHTWRCPAIHALLFAEPGICQAPGCIQAATHDDQYCCYHYSEQIGFPCDCTDDDYEDAMWEGAHGSYNGFVPDVEYAPFGFAA